MNKFLLTLCALLTAGLLSAQTDIADARASFGLGDEVTVTGIVTNDGSLGSIRYIEDGTAGIAIYPGFDWSDFDNEPVPGDEITVTGELTEFNGLLEVGPSISALTINSSGNPLPTPQLITPSEMDESLEGMLVTVEGAVFTQGGQIISGNNTYDFDASGESGVIYVRNSNYLVDEILPAGVTTLIGVVSQFDPDNSGDGYQLLPRSTEDLIPESAINIASTIEQENITQTSFTLEWLTDTPGDSKVEYGLTPALGEEVYSADAVTSHSLELTGLEPGTIYYAKVTSEADGEIAESSITPYATVSESSGDILVYFNHTVDNTVATDELALNIGADMNDTLAAYITRAQHTLDIAAYNLNNDLIVNAINEAHANGVQIRYIAHSGTANIGVGDFNSGIPVLYRPDDSGSGMHNKFLIMDAEYTDLCQVLTGSTNLTTSQLVEDPNNLIIFQDQSLARAYTLEFNELWGSDGPESDAANALFGPNKTINTPKKFIIGGSPVELYFSPTDGTTRAIEEAIFSTEYDLEFALLAFTRDDLGDAIIEVGSTIFVNPVGIIEQINTTGSEYENMLNAGIEVYSHQGVTHDMHHKMAIVDHSQEFADPLVVTGSHNWSTSAETVNDENTVVVHDARIANLYHQAFRGILLDMGVGVQEQTREDLVKVSPNPTNGQLTIRLKDAPVSGTLAEVRDLSGRIVQTFALGMTGNSIDVSALPAGTYVLTIDQGHTLSATRFVKY
jgi:phosphatidylserine/phosphatidylglycerophosphate/cardiolipin synthase-like enzyme